MMTKKLHSKSAPPKAEIFGIASGGESTDAIGAWFQVRTSRSDDHPKISAIV